MPRIGYSESRRGGGAWIKNVASGIAVMNPRDKIASNEKITDWRHNSSQKYDTRGDLSIGSGLSINVNAAVGFVSSSQTGSQRTIHPAGEAPKCNPHKSNFTALLSPRQVFDDSRSPRVLVDRGVIVNVNTLESVSEAKRHVLYNLPGTWIVLSANSLVDFHIFLSTQGTGCCRNEAKVEDVYDNESRTAAGSIPGFGRRQVSKWLASLSICKQEKDWLKSSKACIVNYEN